MTLHHRLDGPEDAPLLILGPSMGTTLELWTPQLPALTRDWRVLRYDLPGHGGSPSRPGVLLPDLAADVLALADAQGAERFAYGGVSVGAAIGVLAASAAPWRVSGLVLCCTSARFGDPAGWSERADLVLAEGLGPIAEVIAGRWFTPAFRDAERYVAMLRAADPEGYAALCRAIGRYDGRDRLAAITAPTLVISGAEDPTSPPAHGKELAAGVPDATLVVLDGAAHLASVERADAVTQAMLRLLERAR